MPAENQNSTPLIPANTKGSPNLKDLSTKQLMVYSLYLHQYQPFWAVKYFFVFQTLLMCWTVSTQLHDMCICM